MPCGGWLPAKPEAVPELAGSSPRLSAAWPGSAGPGCAQLPPPHAGICLRAVPPARSSRHSWYSWVLQLLTTGVGSDSDINSADFAAFQFNFHFRKMFKLNNLPESQEEPNSLRLCKPAKCRLLFLKFDHANSTPKVYGRRLKRAGKHRLKRWHSCVFVQSGFTASGEQHWGWPGCIDTLRTGHCWRPMPWARQL